MDSSASNDPHAERSVSQLMDLTGRVALVTGGTGYLGSAMARGLAEVGATVVVSSRDEPRAAEAARALPSPGGAMHVGVSLDHMDEQSARRGFAEAAERAGQIDILINNGHEPLGKDWTEVTQEEFARQLANAAGYFTLARLLRDHAVARSASASIVLLGSMYGLVASYPDAYADLMPASPVAYHALKGGIVHMTRHLAVYWAADRVRVNCLSPGPFPNVDRVPAELIERLEMRSPMKRMGTADELKAAVVFLASDGSSYMTGQNLVIDGGWTAW